MKSKDSLIKLRNKLKRYNKQYYNLNPTIDDSKYDKLKREYDYLLSKNPKLKKFDDLGIGTPHQNLRNLNTLNQCYLFQIVLI